jgi:cytochrome c553
MKRLVLTIAVLVLFLGLGRTAHTQNQPSGPSEHAGTGIAKDWSAPDQAEAIERSKTVMPLVKEVLVEPPGVRSQRFIKEGYSIADIKHSYFLLDSPIIKQTEDKYRPVRFMHTKHAASVKDCTLCHHARPEKNVLKDARANDTLRCSACHQKSFDPQMPNRIGLKAAYHLNCMGCHKKEGKGPVGCQGCHLRNQIDHKDKIKLSGNPTPMQVTEECLRCHEKAGNDMLKSAHWLWKGPSPYTLKHAKSVQIGKSEKTLNNF